MLTAIDLLTSPAAKLNEPLAVMKSLPAIAEPSTVV
jgi:hypothetical protein